jgi:hypothetical protein
MHDQISVHVLGSGRQIERSIGCQDDVRFAKLPSFRPSRRWWKIRRAPLLHSGCDPLANGVDLIRA